MPASGTLVIGLDIAGRTGIAEGFAVETAPRLSSQQFALPDDTSPIEAFGRAVRFMATRLRDNLPAAIFVEAPVPENKLFAAGISQHSSNMIRIGLYGALTGVARAKGIPVINAGIARVRTNILGHRHGHKGKAAKQATFDRCKLLGWAPANNDESDAAAVWLWGCGEIAKGLLDRELAL